MDDITTVILARLEALEAAVASRGHNCGPPLDLNEDDGLDRWVSTPDLARHYNVTTRTIERWRRDPRMRFPQPMNLNGRNYTSLKAVRRYDREHAAAETKGS